MPVQDAKSEETWWNEVNYTAHLQRILFFFLIQLIMSLVCFYVAW
jgi:hypothetical protein